MLFGEVPDGWSLVGMAILVLAGLYAFHRERRVSFAGRA
jgi:drug/metabolite transporter (DMT)-like permease